MTGGGGPLLCLEEMLTLPLLLFLDALGQLTTGLQSLAPGYSYCCGGCRSPINRPVILLDTNNAAHISYPNRTDNVDTIDAMNCLIFHVMNALTRRIFERGPPCYPAPAPQLSVTPHPMAIAPDCAAVQHHFICNSKGGRRWVWVHLLPNRSLFLWRRMRSSLMNFYK